MSLSNTKNILLGLTIIFFMGCEGEQGETGATGETGASGLNSLVNITNVSSGDTCENGGVKVDFGVDNNANGILEGNEILGTNYICNGVDGNTSLTSVVTEPAGDNCENGGVKIDSGVDVNGNGTLDADEITTTAYVCNGIDGNDGLIKTTNEAAGINCENGGLKIDSGIDANSNGTLEDDEITATAYVCNGIDGNNSLTKITDEAAGTNCENGGLKIDTGVDTNGNGVLDDTEIRATAYACNGVDGNISLVNVTDELAGENCENGGVKIESGVDDNGNGTLDEEEITVTRFVCDGIDGGFDEQIRLYLIKGAGNGVGTRNTPDIGGEIIDFDKRNYIGVDSIIFIPKLRTEIANTAIIAELYDITNNRVINNSRVSSTSTVSTLVESANVYSDLPEEEIDLAIKLTPGDNTLGQNVRTGYAFGTSYLMLYRSN
ncbi:hypothetical protein [uncultured Algibacter sp.]|uniref:DUF7151 family protein n=1 Tax=uncultured Algibacter sp. TaxID=298659 RepID=UPI00260DED97|nr:hypothetical protein [uncultured Algibacter sp.]